MFLCIEMKVKTVDIIKNVSPMKNVKVLNFSIDSADEKVNDLELFLHKYFCTFAIFYGFSSIGKCFFTVF